VQINDEKHTWVRLELEWMIHRPGTPLGVVAHERSVSEIMSGIAVAAAEEGHLTPTIMKPKNC
jgi:hypothetical protein